MSLIRQFWLLLSATLVLALLGSVSVNVDTARENLQTQLRIKNSDTAAVLSLALSKQGGDEASLAQVLSAQFETGFYQRIRHIGIDGKVRFQREASAKPLDAAQWFVDWVHLESLPGVAQVSDGSRTVGSIEVQSHAAFAYDELWRASLRSAATLALIAALAGSLAFLGVARLRRPLDAAVDQARALERGEYLTLVEPNTPELRRLTRAMNSMVTRLKLIFEAQAAQVESMRRQANCDALTGLSSRAHFLGQLEVAMRRDDGASHGGLVLLRVVDLAEVNRVLGRTAADRMLVAIAQVLQTYSVRGDGCLVGRLNGSDFALGLPVGGMSEETALALAGALRAALPAFGPGIGVVFGAVEISRAMAMGELMGAADMALARAEARGAFAVEAAGENPVVAAGLGEAAWRQHIQAALVAGRVKFGEVPVHDPAGRLIHVECPLRLQLEPDGPYEVAARWMPLAMRGRLTASIDLTATGAALRAIAKDRRARCVSLAAASLADIEFIPRLRTVLADAPEAAKSLWITVGESAAIDHFARVRELARQLKPCFVKLGLEHAGEKLSRIDRLLEAGLAFVKLDSAVTRGVAADANRSAFVSGVVTLLHSVSLQVFAEGVAERADADALVRCGVDGFAGARELMLDAVA